MESLPARSSKDSVYKWLDVLAGDIWQLGGYRWSRHGTYQAKQARRYTAYYHCCQDEAFERDEKPQIRAARRMCRYACQGNLTLSASLEDQTVSLELRHKHHEAYADFSLTPEAPKYTNDQVDS